MSAPQLAPPPGAPWPAPGSVEVFREEGARRVWLLHTARDGGHHAIPFDYRSAQLLASALSEAGREALEGRP